MARSTARDGTTLPTFREMVFSDSARHRPAPKQSWATLLLLLPLHPGLVASVFLRAQQCLVRRGRIRAAWALRTLCGALTGADFIPGCEVGLGVFFTHPSGVVLGSGSTVGNDVTFASGVVLGVRSHDLRDPAAGFQPYPTIGDGVLLGAHAVVLGGVRVGDYAVVGANSVVRDDVGRDSIVSGIPARHVAVRKTPGAAGPASD
jgi:serine O-acetyltransferase